MRFSAPILIAAAGISTAFASPAIKARQEVGTFDTFTDPNCSQGGTGVDVTGNEPGYIDFGPGIRSVDSHLPDNCALIIWADTTTRPPYQVIHPGRANQCITLEIDSTRLFWNAVCE